MRKQDRTSNPEFAVEYILNTKQQQQLDETFKMLAERHQNLTKVVY